MITIEIVILCDLSDDPLTLQIIKALSSFLNIQEQS